MTDELRPPVADTLDEVRAGLTRYLYANEADESPGFTSCEQIARLAVTWLFEKRQLAVSRPPVADNDQAELARRLDELINAPYATQRTVAAALLREGWRKTDTSLDGPTWDFDIHDLVTAPGGWPSGTAAVGRILDRYADWKRGNSYVVEWPNPEGSGTTAVHMQGDRLRAVKKES